MIVYIVEMCRWADRENHSYVIGVWTTLAAALDAGLSNASWRARKYEPTITAHNVDGGGLSDTMCRTEERALSLYREITGKDWVEKEEPVNE